MAKEKKPPKPKEFANNPFAGLKKTLKEKAATAPVVAPPKPAPSPPPIVQGGASTAGSPEERLFADEMAGVRRIDEDPRGRLGAPERTIVPGKRREQDDAEVFAELADLVSGGGKFDITATDEYIEGINPELDRRLLRKLKRGDFSFEAHLDLHGLTSDEARQEVAQFLDRSRKSQKRCVLLVHGRGLHSKDQMPVLKERLTVWFTHGALGKQVMAFCTARPEDGGAGAMYVLLRR